MNTNQTISRAELAAAMDYSKDALRKRERSLGLRGCRVKHPSREVHYNRRRAFTILRALSFTLNLKQSPGPAKSVATSYGVSNSESGHEPWLGT